MHQLSNHAVNSRKISCTLKLIDFYPKTGRSRFFLRHSPLKIDCIVTLLRLNVVNQSRKVTLILFENRDKCIVYLTCFIGAVNAEHRIRKEEKQSAEATKREQERGKAVGRRPIR